MAALRCASRLASLTMEGRSVLSRLPGFTAGQATHTALRSSSQLLVRAAAAAAELAKEPVLDNAMFCYQCEQTTKGIGCTTVGLCGKTPETAFLQDLLTYSLKGLGCWAHFAHRQGVEVPREAYRRTLTKQAAINRCCHRSCFC